MGGMGLPGFASVVVVGGGVMGCSTLYHLTLLGVTDAVLLERHQLTSGTTWHSAAQVRALRSSYALTELIRYSIDLYARLEKETGQSVGWINKGSLSLACNPDRLIHIRRQLALAQKFGLRAQELTPAEARERWQPMNADDVLAAVFAPEDGRVSPSDLCAALIKGAKARGARVYENTAVETALTRGGRVVGVRAAGAEIRCDAVAVCAGLWSREAARGGGADAPLWPCEHFYLLTEPIAGLRGNLPTLSDHDSHLYIRDESGGLLVGCFEPRGKAMSAQAAARLRPFELLPEDWAHFEPMMANAMRRLPALATAGARMLLNGAESFTPDGMFLLGETAQTRGLFLGCGMNSVGVATGGGGGWALAHCIARGHSPLVLPEADPNRFPRCWQSAAALAARAPEVLGRHYEIAFPARQPQTARGLRHPPLTALWRARGAYFGQFCGWERPLYFGKSGEPRPTFARQDWFGQVGGEVAAASSGAAVFDVSTLGKIAARGAEATAFLNHVCARNIESLMPNHLLRAGMLNERGGVVGDVVVMRLGEDEYLLYSGTAAVGRDLAWLRRRADGYRVSIFDESERWAVLAVSGAEAGAVLAAVAGGESCLPRRYGAWAECAVAGCWARVARLSYVGELGWEVTCAAADAAAVAEAVLAAGAAPAGVLAHSAMRTERGYGAYGHEIDEGVLPMEAGMRVDWDGDFVGRAALARMSAAARRRRRLARMVLAAGAPAADAPQPQGDEPVLAAGEVVGQTTSAAYGYRIGRAVALGVLEVAPVVAVGHQVQINIAGARHPAQATFV